jgi:transcriptional regulator with XRE-family HTH domain
MYDSTMMVEPPSFGAYLRHLRTYGREAQRVGQLSRAELATRARAAFSYVTKLEQGAAQNPSTEVVDHLADVLGVDDVERQHLHDLVVYDREASLPPLDGNDTVEVTDQMRTYINNLVPHLAGVVDDAWNVLYSNAEYARIYRHLADPAVGNVLVWFFQVPEARAIMIDWETEARLTVAWLRALMVRRPRSRSFRPLLDRLSASSDFCRMWTAQEVLMGRPSPYMFVHDLDRNEDLRLLAEVYAWPDPTKALQMYLGVRVAPYGEFGSGGS